MLEGVPDPERTARYRCALVIAGPGGSIEFQTEAVCEGRIAHAPRGAHGFGYDPLFIATGFDRTVAELDPEQKNRISHRGQAGRAARRFLEARLEQD